MTLKVDSRIREIRKVKLAKNRKASDVFSFIDCSVFTSGENKNAAASISSIAVDKIEKKARRAEFRKALNRIAEQWSPASVRDLTKKRRRTLKSKFTEIEWNAFCTYVSQCRRGFREAERRAKKKKNRKPRRLTYEVYIKSPIWEQVRNRYYRRNPSRCAACGTAQHIHLHHMIYGKFGEEKDNELVPLCEMHHSQYHAKNGTKRNMIASTRAFIEKIRAANQPHTIH